MVAYLHADVARTVADNVDYGLLVLTGTHPNPENPVIEVHVYSIFTMLRRCADQVMLMGTDLLLVRLYPVRPMWQLSSARAQQPSSSGAMASYIVRYPLPKKSPSGFHQLKRTRLCDPFTAGFRASRSDADNNAYHLCSVRMSLMFHSVTRTIVKHDSMREKQMQRKRKQSIAFALARCLNEFQVIHFVE
jgi:hypothetical protein